MKRSLAASVAAAGVAALALFTGAALAGGHDGGAPGHSHDWQGSQQQSQQSGWQQQSQSRDQSQPQQAQTQQPQQSHSDHGRQWQQQSSSQVQTGGDNSQGVKPSSTTAHGTHGTWATAGSGSTKQYGNGKTAGQIVEQRGASSDTVLHGPGNSQPHKVVSCGHRHEVDVHAYKGSGSPCGESAPQTQVAPAGHEVEHKQAEAQKPVVVQQSCGSVAGKKEFGEHGDDVMVETDCTQSATGSVQAACTQTVTVTAPGGVWHRTGSESNPYVFIHPSGNSAHYSKHAEDIVVPSMTKTETVQVPCGETAGAKTVESVVSQCQQAQEEAVAAAKPVESTQAPTQQVAATQAQQQATTTVVTTTTAPAATTTAPSTGGVAGVQATVPTSRPAATAAAKPATHGVLGAQTTLRPHSGVLGTIRSTTLPFTGLPLWPVVLGALALIGAGAAVRRTQRGEL